MTDQVQLPEEPNSPPIVMGVGEIQPGSHITFDASSPSTTELKIPVQVRDDDIKEPLEARWRVVANGRPMPPDCPESTIAPTGAILREAYTIVINAAKLSRGACNEVEFVVSSDFLASCETHPEAFDIVGDETNDLGRAVFWVFEVSNHPFMDPDSAQTLLATCPAVDRTPQPLMEK